MRQRIVVIEDEEDIADALCHSLSRQGFKVDRSSDGRRGLRLVREVVPDLVLLDLMLPGMDGTEVCRSIRSDPLLRNVFIIMVTAKSEEGDVLIGLALGADGYVTKPFKTRELLARVGAVLRRGDWQDGAGDGEIIRRGRLVIDVPRYEVMLDNRPLELTATEFRLLNVLAANPHRVLTRDQLLNKAIGENAIVIDRNIDVHIRSIRKKLGDARDMIQTVRSMGYRFGLRD
ncbi:MAG: response regulator [Opitutaceae bacterium]